MGNNYLSLKGLKIIYIRFPCTYKSVMREDKINKLFIGVASVTVFHYTDLPAGKLYVQ